MRGRGPKLRDRPFALKVQAGWSVALYGFSVAPKLTNAFSGKRNQFRLDIESGAIWGLFEGAGDRYQFMVNKI